MGAADCVVRHVVVILLLVSILQDVGAFELSLLNSRNRQRILTQISSTTTTTVGPAPKIKLPIVQVLINGDVSAEFIIGSNMDTGSKKQDERKMIQTD